MSLVCLFELLELLYFWKMMVEEQLFKTRLRAPENPHLEFWTRTAELQPVSMFSFCEQLSVTHFLFDPLLSPQFEQIF